LQKSEEKVKKSARNLGDLHPIVARITTRVKPEDIDRVLSEITINPTATDPINAGVVPLTRGPVADMLGFLMKLVRRRDLSATKARRKRFKNNITKQPDSDAWYLARWIDIEDPKGLLCSVAEQGERLADETPEKSGWPNERIAGEYLPSQYQTIFHREPTAAINGECARFIATVMQIVTRKPYTTATAVRAMKAIKAEYQGKPRDPAHGKGRKRRTR
jgi:hypothetical protein